MPIPLLGSVLGLGGLGLMWRVAATTLGAPGWIGEAVLAVMALVFVLLTALHSIRAARHPGMTRAEFASPALVPFFSVLPLGGLLLAATMTPYWPLAARHVWEVSTLLHLALGAALLARWLRGEADPALMAPPLIIPFVANILVALFGVPLGYSQVAWAMLGIGLLFWLPLQTLLLHRLLAGPPLPPAMRPSVMILLAPPSVGAVTVLVLEGRHLTPLALGLAGLATLYAAALALMPRHLTAGGFALSWWGFTFPACAYAILLMEVLPGQLGAPGLVISGLAVAVATAIVLRVCWGTSRFVLGR